jgi:hypothetical protein
MKYRIKITTYNNGRKTYLAQVKKGWFWFSLYFEYIRNKKIYYDDDWYSALRKIDKHFNTKKQSTEFVLINK